jgi:hypothetical protein
MPAGIGAAIFWSVIVISVAFPARTSAVEPARAVI